MKFIRFNTIVSCLLFWQVFAVNIAAQEVTKITERKINFDDFVENLQGELKASADNKSAVIEVRGFCSEVNSEGIEMPMISWAPSSPTRGSNFSLRKALLGNDNFLVVQKSPGIVLVSDSNISTDVLKVTINHIYFTTMQQYSPNQAIDALFEAPSVISALKNSNTRRTRAILGIYPAPSDHKAHLDRSLRGITIDQALTLILKKFGGVMIYKECVAPDGQKKFDITYSPN